MLAVESMVAMSALLPYTVALTMQLDGNLVMYGAGQPVWSSNTYGGPDVSYLVLQNDGNLAIYRQGPAAWSTGTPQ